MSLQFRQCWGILSAMYSCYRALCPRSSFVHLREFTRISNTPIMLQAKEFSAPDTYLPYQALFSKKQYSCLENCCTSTGTFEPRSDWVPPSSCIRDEYLSFYQIKSPWFPARPNRISPLPMSFLSRLDSKAING